MRTATLGTSLAALAALSVTFVACGDDDDADPSTTVATTSTAVIATTTTGAPPTTSPPTTSRPTTAPPTTTAVATTITPTTVAATTTEPVPDGPIQIDVMVGVDSSPERIERVSLGSPVTFNITNPDADDEFHLHDYDIGDEILVPAGTMATFNFVADVAGSFPLESHVTDDVLLVLEVS